MNILNIFANEPYVESATVDHIVKHIYRNFDRVIKIIVELSKDNRCIICGILSLNYKSKASLANHLIFFHRKRTMEYIRDKVMTLTLNEYRKLIDHE